jgi:hypothetical protein
MVHARKATDIICVEVGMNSKQRRQDRKKWKYRISTTARDWDHYNAMWEWLKSQHGIINSRCGWRDRVRNRTNLPYENYQVVWQFTKENDATLFALKWI